MYLGDDIADLDISPVRHQRSELDFRIDKLKYPLGHAKSAEYAVFLRTVETVYHSALGNCRLGSDISGADVLAQRVKYDIIKHISVNVHLRLLRISIKLVFYVYIDFYVPIAF